MNFFPFHPLDRILVEELEKIDETPLVGAAAKKGQRQKRKTPIEIGDKQLFQSVEDRKKLVRRNLKRKDLSLL